MIGSNPTPRRPTPRRANSTYSSQYLVRRYSHMQPPAAQPGAHFIPMGYRYPPMPSAYAEPAQTIWGNHGVTHAQLVPAAVPPSKNKRIPG